MFQLDFKNVVGGRLNTCISFEMMNFKWQYLSFHFKLSDLYSEFEMKFKSKFKFLNRLFNQIQIFKHVIELIKSLNYDT